MREKLAIGFFLTVTVVPLALGLGYAAAYSTGLAGLLGKGFTLQHWYSLWFAGSAVNALLYSLYLAVASLLPAIAIALALSYFIIFKKYQYLYQWLFLPLLVPPVAAAFSFFYLLSPSGILARASYYTGIISSMKEFPRLVNDVASVGIVATHVWLVTPFFTLLFINIIKRDQLETLLQLSQTLGSSHNAFVRRIFVPVVLYRSAPLLLLYGLFIFGTYEIPLLLGRQAPRAATVYIIDRLNSYDLLEKPQGYALAVFYCIITISIINLAFGKRRASLF